MCFFHTCEYFDDDGILTYYDTSSFGGVMAKVVRTVRFDQSEIKKIEEFLKRNPFLDFSTLTRIAISHFIENPTLNVHPVKSKRAPQRSMEA